MAIKRRQVHLDDTDVAALARLAKRLSKETGHRITTSGLIRQAVKEFLRKKVKGKRV